MAENSFHVDRYAKIRSELSNIILEKNVKNLEKNKNPGQSGIGHRKHFVIG